MAALAFAYDMPLILLLVGFVYLCETLSDIIQVTYFKLTHGKRIFKMAPLHHHFEMCGWKETKVAPFSASWPIWASWTASAHNLKPAGKEGTVWPAPRVKNAW